uniref:Uncharacterized protein n=1 Tax=Arundo donax TaxID=35708 RepID=A0A0A9A7H0_ARUDO
MMLAPAFSLQRTSPSTALGSELLLLLPTSPTGGQRSHSPHPASGVQEFCSTTIPAAPELTLMRTTTSPPAPIISTQNLAASSPGTPTTVTAAPSASPHGILALPSRRSPSTDSGQLAPRPRGPSSPADTVSARVRLRQASAASSTPAEVPGSASERQRSGRRRAQERWAVELAGGG